MNRVGKPQDATGQRADRQALAEINDLIDDGVYDAASVLAWEVQRTAPGDPAVWLLLARIDYLRERFAAAMYAARMATRLDPSSSDAWLALATTAVIRARWRTEGLDAAFQATALAHADARTWTVLSQLHLVGGAVYEAAVAAEQAVRVDPTDRGGHLMLGETALDAGELTHAEAAFRAVLELDGDDPDGLLGLAEVLEAQGIDPTEALAQYGDPTPTGRRRLGTRSARGAPRHALRDAFATSRGTAAVVVVACVVFGLVAGLAVPGLGLVRALVGATALALMWIAVQPLRAARVVRAPTTMPGTSDGDAPDGTASTADTEEDAGRRAAAALADASLADELARVGGHDDRRASHDAVDDDPPEPAAADATARTGDDPPADGPQPAAAREVEMPDDPEKLAELSRSRLAVSDLELAHAAASRLEAREPGSVAAHRALAAVALAERDYAQARVHYRRVLELEPLDQEAHERLALVGDEDGRATPRFGLRGFRSRR